MKDKKKAYEWNAADYRDSSSQQKKWGRELLAKLSLDGRESILDIGCGDGKLTAEIAELVPEGHVLGIDSSANMIAFARESYPSETHPNLSWEVRDARDLDFDERFDVLFSNAALHWVPDQARVLQGAKKSLKSGGRILFQMGGRGNAAEVSMTLATMLASEKWSAYFRDFSLPYTFCCPEDYTLWLQEAGLIPLRVELVHKDMTHVGPEGFASWIRTTWLPFTQRIPEDLRDRFIAQLVAGYLEVYPPDGEGLVHVKAIRLEVEAQKPH